MTYEIGNQYIEVKISEKGAELQSVVKDGVEYLWSGDAKYWTGRAPLLFPFVGRLTDGKYTLKGKEYEMGNHGFARKVSYKVVGQSPESITFELEDSEETYKAYPCHFRLRVTYTLKENRIEIQYNVENKTDDTMYFGIGGHPGFKVPLEEGLEFTDYYLEFAEKSYPDKVGLTEACFLSGENHKFELEDDIRLRMHHAMFDEDAIVLQNAADTVTLKSDKSERKVTVSYPEMPYVGFWHSPKTDAPYICIEPWVSLPSRQDIVEEFRCKGDLVRVKGNETYVNRWSITIE